MEKVEYGIKEATPSLPDRALLVVPHKDKVLTVSYPAFGPNTYSGNLAEMQKRYSHSEDLPNISFRELTTSESISAVAYKFAERAKPEIFDPRWFQAGRIARTSKGVFANLPKDAQGNPILDEKVLNSYLDKAEKVKVGNGHIYLGENDFGFAEYETFEQKVQDCDTFAESGLARVLEHTKGRAEKLREIASPKLYKRGVNIWGFDSVSESVLRVARLNSGRVIDSGRLYVDGYNWGNYGGYAFGGLVSGEASTQKN